MQGQEGVRVSINEDRMRLCLPFLSALGYQMSWPAPGQVSCLGSFYGTLLTVAGRRRVAENEASGC